MVAVRPVGTPRLSFLECAVPLPDGERSRSLLLLRLSARLLAVAFTGQGLFDPEFLARLQVEGVPFDLSDDVLLQNLSLEAAERVLHRLAILELYLSQRPPPSRPDSSGGLIRPLPASEPSHREPAFPSIPCWV